MTPKNVPGTSFGWLCSRVAKERCPAHCVFFLLLITVILAAATWLRLADLGNRPMHCDEAVHGVKFGLLLEKGEYTYNPREYHGPGLNYLTLPVARWAGVETITQLSETDLRLVPALFGILLVGLPWLVRQELGRAEAASAAGLTALCPAMVFYSRYYIQEMLLVCFTFAAVVALWRYARLVHTAVLPRTKVRQTSLLVVLGACLGMMHASKETFIIALFAMILAASLTLADRRTAIGLFRPGDGWFKRWKRVLTPFCVPFCVAVCVSVLFHSSFLTRPRGVSDSFATYLHYFARAAGEGSAGQHAYPWYHYFRLLFWWQTGDGPIWTEAVIGGLAVVGLVASIWGKGIHPNRLSAARFLGVYTVAMTIVYSALSYKTPWCALGFLHGMILLAGIGMVVLVRGLPGRSLKFLASAGLTVAVVHLGWQAHRASFVAFEDPNNPYVYAHTTGDVPQLVGQLRHFAEFDGQAAPLHVQVICPDHDYWPLPWYMRDFSTVGWFAKIPQATPGDVIIIQPGEETESALKTYLYVDPLPGWRHLYVAAFEKHGEWLLRPGVPLRVYARRKLWVEYLRRDDRLPGIPGTESL